MSERHVRDLIGRRPTAEVFRALNEQSEWFPVLADGGTIVDLAPWVLPLDEAAQRGWIFDPASQTYHVDQDLGVVVAALLAHEGPFTPYADTVARARGWLLEFQVEDIPYWVAARVRNAAQAMALDAFGLGPTDVPEGQGWLSDEELQAMIEYLLGDAPDRADAR